MVLAAIGIVGYGGKISPPPKGVIVSRTDDVSDPEGKLNMPVCTFLSMVFSFTDIFGVLPYKEGTMEEPLSGNNL